MVHGQQNLHRDSNSTEERILRKYLGWKMINTFFTNKGRWSVRLWGTVSPKLLPKIYSRHIKKIVQQIQLQDAHDQAFSEVCKVIDTNILRHNEVMKLTDLCFVYVSSLHESNFPNKNYRSGKLKHTLQSNSVYCNKLCFATLDIKKGQYQAYLIFNWAIDIGTVVRCAYSLGTGDPI